MNKVQLVQIAFLSLVILGSISHVSRVIVAQNPIHQLSQASGSDTIYHETFDSGTVAGIFGNATAFDGTNPISVADSADLSPTQAVTVSAWFKTTTAPGTSKTLVAKSGAYNISIGGSAGTQVNFVIRGQLSSDTLSASVPSVNNGVWHNLVGVFDGDVTKIYLDGVLKGTKDSTRTSIDDTTGTLTLGSFVGTLDDVRVYGRGLSENEVVSLYAAAGNTGGTGGGDTGGGDTGGGGGGAGGGDTGGGDTGGGDPPPEPPPIDPPISTGIPQSAADYPRTPSSPRTVTWTRPIGIPEPPFGIREDVGMYILRGSETCSTNPNKCYDFGRGPEIYKLNAYGDPYTHYVDVSHPAATDISNTFGTPEKPRKSVPRTLTAGSVAEVHGGSYVTGNFNGNTMIGIETLGTPERPVFIRGASQSERPTIVRGIWGRGHYGIYENLLWDANAQYANLLHFRVWSTDPIGHNHHVAVRHSEARNISRTSGSTSMFTQNGGAGNPVRYYVYYNNRIHGDDVDVLKAAPVTREKDSVGIAIAANSEYVWILDNVIYGMGGDSVGAGHGDNYTSKYYYIGRNEMFDNGENAFDAKEVDTIIVSQNKMYNMQGYSQGTGGGGSVAVIHYGPQLSPKNVWFLYNEIYDADVGIAVGGTSLHTSYIIGNTFHDIRNPEGTGRAFAIRNSAPGHLIGNVFYNNDKHIWTGPAITAPITMYNNTLGNITDTTTGFHIYHESGTPANASDMKSNLFTQSNGPVRIKWGATATASEVPSGKCVGCVYNGSAPTPVANPFASLYYSIFNVTLDGGTPPPPPNDPPTTTYLPGDFDRDGRVTTLDISAMAQYWNRASTVYDLSGDGVVNSLDYSTVVRNFSF